MTKIELQKELLERVKEGIKPSDLKKKNVKPKQDEGYESDSSDKSIPTPPITPNQKIRELLIQINSLQKQLQTYKDFKEADLKIKEKYKEKIKELEQKTSDLEKQNHDLNYLLKTGKNSDIIKKLQTKIREQDKTIQELKKQVNSKGNIPQELFTCYHCKNHQQISLLVLELPEGKLCQPCWAILRKKTKENLKDPVANKPFICVVCEQEKQETPIYKKVEISYKSHLIKGQEYPVCSSCSPHVKEYNENENRKLEEWE